MTTQRERDAAKRQQRLAEIDQAIEQGSLVIRPMTDAERARYPVRERPAGPRRSRFKRLS
jgi:hypothetical protein